MEELIQLRINLLKASRFIRVHNAPMDADQIIESSLQIVNNLIEASAGKTLNENGALPIPDVVGRSEQLLAFAKHLCPKEDVSLLMNDVSIFLNESK